MDAAIWTIITSTVLTLVAAIMTYLREGRTHRWQVEQSRIDQEQRLRVAADLKQHSERKHVALTAKIDANTAVNVAAIEAGEKAYTEANNLSLKMQQQGLQLRAGSDDPVWPHE